MLTDAKAKIACGSGAAVVQAVDPKAKISVLDFFRLVFPSYPPPTTRT